MKDILSCFKWALMGAPLESSTAKNSKTTLPLSLLQIICCSVSSYNILLIHLVFFTKSP